MAIWSLFLWKVQTNPSYPPPFFEQMCPTRRIFNGALGRCLSCGRRRRKMPSRQSGSGGMPRSVTIVASRRWLRLLSYRLPAGTKRSRIATVFRRVRNGLMISYQLHPGRSGLMHQLPTSAGTKRSRIATGFQRVRNGLTHQLPTSAGTSFEDGSLEVIICLLQTKESTRA